MAGLLLRHKINENSEFRRNCGKTRRESESAYWNTLNQRKANTENRNRKAG
ncbi:hypothetical protein X777_03559 [Ooceraea biroi]|uniref:Uncharacterized protein n=1 Tax=Ooceraea biroi TaxID=2015173 RepID=A0A026WKD3_OOCBI|nr:hypothetical protein X777_03559 [Ooceraea biroi]